MKISKVSASSSTKDTETLNTMVHEDAIKYIKKAIDVLGAHARRTQDAKSKEAIANLSVILLDLQK